MNSAIEDGAQLLLIGGRSGVGKTTVANEVSEQLQAAGVAHCVIDGDNLDAAHPKPAGDPDGTGLTETNLTAMWTTYAAAGYHRLIYVNTVSVLEAEMITRSMGGSVAVRAVLLTAAHDTVRTRLEHREVGSALAVHLDRSRTRAAQLDRAAGADVVRLVTDARSVREVAADVVTASGW